MTFVQSLVMRDHGIVAHSKCGQDTKSIIDKFDFYFLFIWLEHGHVMNAHVTGL